MKNDFFFSSILFVVLLLSAGCSNSSDKVATISINTDSEYVNTFEDLNLGILFDFNFKLPNANHSWVNLWVDRYNDGEKESQPLTKLSYGNSPNEVDEGHLGFGMINPKFEDTLVFLYGPAARTQPSIIEKDPRTDFLSSWDYAIGNEGVELEIGATKLLAAYRETEKNSLHTVDLQDEHSVNEMWIGHTMLDNSYKG